MSIDTIREIVINYRIDWLIHFAAILSATGEKNLHLALRINVDGLNNVLEVGRQFNLKIFVPSTIGAFGGSLKVNTPDITPQRPKTIYGVSKVYCELLGEYFFHKYKTDFRCIRFPGIMSAETKPGGGTTDYAVQIFHDALRNGRHECYLKPDTRLPMMYIDDCLKSVIQILEAPDSCLRLRTYNINSLSFTPAELAEAIKLRIPNFHIEYHSCHTRQAIADSWPESLDDTNARKDWGWDPQYDLSATVDAMLGALDKQITTTYRWYEDRPKKHNHDITLIS